MVYARVILERDGAPPKAFELKDRLTIGRTPDNDVFLPEPFVSRSHALIERTSDGVIVRDLKSGNGTYVAGERVDQRVLMHNDLIEIGTLRFRYLEADDAESGVAEDQRFHTVLYPGASDEQATFYASDDVRRSLLETKADSLQADETLTRRLTAIYEVNQTVASCTDLNEVFERLLEIVFAQVPANNAVIFLWDRDNRKLVAASERRSSDVIRVSSSIVKRSHERGEAIILHDALADSRFAKAQSIIQERIGSAMCTPLRHAETSLGVIYVDNRGSSGAFSYSDLEMLTAIAGAAAVAVKNVQYLEELENDFRATLDLLANAIELRDHYTIGHTWRVTRYSVAIAEELGWKGAQLRRVEMGGVLHDIGKIGVDDAVLRKNGPLDADEFAKMKTHPERGAVLMRSSPKLTPLIPFCLYHHERYDGRGYPHGLQGEDIPIEGRIVAVADTFDAMTTDRPYRKGLPVEKAIEEIERGKGNQFDPVAADAFIRAYQKGKIEHIIHAGRRTGESEAVCTFCSAPLDLADLPDGSTLNCFMCRRTLRVYRSDGKAQVALLQAETLEQGHADSA